MPKGFRVTIEDIKRRLDDAHNGNVSIVEKTYVDTQSRCSFVDCDFGEWKAIPNNILRGKKNQHPERARLAKRVSLEMMRSRLKSKHGETVTLIDETYVDQTTPCEFVDVKYGRWSAKPYAVLQGTGHPLRGYATIGSKRRISLTEAVRRVQARHGATITIVEDTFEGWLVPCVFIDIERGQFIAVPRQVARDRSGHPSRTVEKQIASQQQTALAHYGVTHAMKSRTVQDKVARSSNKATTKYHWRTNDPLLCVGSYEVAVVEWLNTNRHDYVWQPGPFEMPDGRTYRPDALIKSGPFTNVYVEVKGYFRDDAREKWEWFHSEHSDDSQFWDERRLKELGILPKKRANLLPE